MQAFILAGGQGQRLLPLTRDRAKPAVPFGGGHRLIDFTFSNCINSGIRHIRVLTQYHCESLRSYLRALTLHIGGKSAAGEVLCLCPVSGKRYRGTADAMYQNIPLIENTEADLVLILSGDHVYRMDYRELVRSHLASGAGVTVAAVEWPLEDAGRFGVFEIDSEGNVTGFQEKPRRVNPLWHRPGSALINMGVYVFSKKILVDALTHDACQATTHDFGKDLIPALVRRKLLSVFDFSRESTRLGSYWRDVGTVESFYRANMDLLVTRFPDPYQNAEWPLYGLEPVHLSESVSSEGEGGCIEDSIISRDVSIGPGSRVVHSNLSPGVRVESDVEIRDSVVLGNVYIGAGSRIHRAILDEDVVISPGSQIGETGIIVIPRDTYLGPGQINAKWKTHVAVDRPNRTPSFS